MANRQTMTISLPAKMVKEVDKIRRQEGRTRSELMREALRLYVRTSGEIPTYNPTVREIRELEKGRTAMRKGEYFSLDEFKTWLLGAERKKARSKKSSARAKA
jgi:predicted transcriptional regulator